MLLVKSKTYRFLCWCYIVTNNLNLVLNVSPMKKYDYVSCAASFICKKNIEKAIK